MLPLRATALTLLALAATGAFAQAPSPLVVENTDDGATTALPIIRNNQIEGFLLIESDATAGARSSLDRILGRSNTPSIGAGLTLPLDNGRRIGASLSLESNPTLGLLCEGTSVSRSFGALAQHCMVANLSPNPAAPLALSQPGLRAEARLEGDRSAISANLGLNRFDLDGPLALPGAASVIGASDLTLSLNSTEVQQEDIGLLGELKFGQSGWVSIGGTLARARIVSANQLPGGLPPQWNSGTLSLSAGHGNFGGEIVGRVIEIPGSTVRYSNVGVGVTWRAPWRARLSVGAENLMSNGRNPFAPSADDEKDESARVPYIRYEQDL
ncbi:hypothetical protein [Arenimonas terrae]|uniref:TonB-dependent receptor n=1 Tax=Arenimonas terrae TaxID=2546226 RepID=A0A5C4RWG8_9GAMM|nr:hypothetical protein [Arenimonas terrae]TNJ35384.1 hypothetical protein E1B00_06410 [Arenimonas terrae]